MIRKATLCALALAALPTIAPAETLFTDNTWMRQDAAEGNPSMGTILLVFQRITRTASGRKVNQAGIISIHGSCGANAEFNLGIGTNRKDLAEGIFEIEIDSSRTYRGFYSVVETLALLRSPESDLLADLGTAKTIDVRLFGGQNFCENTVKVSNPGTVFPEILADCNKDK